MAKEKPEKQPEAAPAEPKKKLPLKKILIIAGILVAQTAAAYFIQKTIFFPTPVNPNAEAEHVSGDGGEHGEEAEADAESEGEESEGGEHGGGKGAESNVAMLDEIIVNPAGTGGRRFLSTIVGFSLKNPKSAASLEAQMPMVRDAAITLLSSKSLDQLASIAYRDTLRAELVATVNGLVKEKPVTGVVFSTYVLQ